MWTTARRSSGLRTTMSLAEAMSVCPTAAPASARPWRGRLALRGEGRCSASGAGWLLKQLDYGEDGVTPYLTMEGYREFRKSVMPVVRRFLDLDGKGLSEEYAEWDDLSRTRL